MSSRGGEGTKRGRLDRALFMIGNWCVSPADFVIGRDIVIAELEPLNDLLCTLPHKAQFGPKNLMGHVWDRTKEHGVKNLFHTLRERAHENFKSLTIQYTCLDVSFDAIVLGTNVGVIFLFDRTCKRLSRLPSEVCLMVSSIISILMAMFNYYICQLTWVKAVSRAHYSISWARLHKKYNNFFNILSIIINLHCTLSIQTKRRSNAHYSNKYLYTKVQ